MKTVLAVFTVLLSLMTFAPKALAVGSGAEPLRLIFTQTNVTSSTYHELVASTTRGLKGYSVVNTGPESVQIAIGAEGSEVAQTVHPASSSMSPVFYPVSVGYGARLSVISLGGTNSSGYLHMNLIYN